MDALNPVGTRRRPLFKTKLIPPAMHHAPLQRSRLYPLLDQGIRHALTSVIAPAGYGKSALLRLWSQQCDVAVGWLNADEGDQSLCSFMEYLVHAIPVWPPSVTAQCADRLWSFADDDPASRLQHVVSELIANVQRIAKETIVIIDGYDRLRQPDIHAALSRILDYAPSHLHLIIASRTALPISQNGVADWDYIRIQARELAMTPHEIAAYSMKHGGAHLKKMDAQYMYELTQGWVTGINAVISLLRPTSTYALNAPSFHEQLDARLAEYFKTQVMTGIPEQMREGLLRMSVAEKMNEALLAELLGKRELGKREEALAAWANNGLFLFASERSGGVYSLHPLFRRFLRNQLKQTSPDLFADMNRISMRWLAEHGFYVEAASCAQQVGDVLSLDAIITGHPAELLRDENLPLLRLLEQFPEARWKDFPVLAWMYAATLVHSRRYAKAEQMLDVADSAIAAQGPVRLPTTGEPLSGYVYGERSRIHMSRNEPELGLRYTQQAAEVLAGPGKLHGMLYFHPCTTSLLNSPYGFWGVLPSSEAVTDYCEPRWTRKDAGYGVILVLAGECRYEAGKFDQARALMNRGLLLGLELNEPGLVVPAYIGLAKIAWCKKDKEAAYAILQEARDRLILMNRHDRIALLDACEIDFRMREGHLKPVREWITRHAVALDAAVDPYRMFESVVLLRALFALGRTSPARLHGQRLLRAAESNRLLYPVVEIRLILAHHDRMQGNLQLSAEKVEGALKIACEQKYSQLFVLEGSPVIPLLQADAKLHGKNRDRRIAAYARKLLALLPDYADRADLAENLTSRLSRQEARVCQLIAEGQMNKQIAEYLGISLETVKKHCQSIYRKLGVKSRREIGRLLTKGASSG